MRSNDEGRGAGDRGRARSPERLAVLLAPLAPGRPGVALIAVILLLAGLVAISAPFLLSSALEERESRLFAARTRARVAADGALSRALWCLSRTTEGTERAGVYGFPFDTPDYDTLKELEVNFDFVRPPAAKGQKQPSWPAELSPDATGMPAALHDPRGEIWKAEIEDEQGKINVNSAPPALIGNLLGSAVLDAPMSANAAEPAMTLSGTYAFPADDNDQTVDGFVRVGREIIAYRSKRGNDLEGLVRGCFGTDVEAHPADSLVYDARAWAIAAYKFMNVAGGGRLIRFQSVPAIARISDLRISLGGKTMAMEPESIEALERCLTAVSFRPKADGWVRREALVQGAFDADCRVFVLRDNANFGPGTVVRFLNPAGRVLGYGRVFSAEHKQPPDPRGARILLEYGCGFASDGRTEVFAEAELPHAINVNTARFPVLVAAMTGLALRGGGRAVSPGQASLVANRLINKVVRDEKGRDVQAIRNKEDLDAVLFEAVQAGEIRGDQRLAILENATVPGSTLLRQSTVPFCFRAYNLFTIEASAAVNSPTSWRPLAVHTIREMVQMPTDAAGVFLVRSQKEFEEQIKSGVGRKVNTWPAWLGKPENGNVPDESVADGVGDVRLATGRVSPSLPGTAIVEHFEDNLGGRTITPDGLILEGNAVPFGGAFAVGANGVQPGSAEAWFASPDWAGNLFHASESHSSNYLDVSYDSNNGELVMELADGTVNDGEFPIKTVQYRQPFNLGRNTWQHIRAVYKSTRLGGQAFQVDGGMVPPSGPGRYSPMAALGQDLDNWAGHSLSDPVDVSVDDASLFPAYGAFIIDGEIFEYATKDGNTFRNARRGRRYTQPAVHRAGAAVQIYGYSVGISDIPLVSGQVAEDVSANTQTRINKPAKAGPPAVPGGIDDTQTVIPVNSTDGFQSAGYLWCGQECIYYGRKTATEFQDCVRGQLAGPAAAHGDRSTLTQISLMVTNYNNYPGAGIVQVDDSTNQNRVSWIDYSQKRRDAAGHSYLMPVFQRDSHGNWYHTSFRGTYGTGSRSHGKGAKVLPVFNIHGPRCGDASSPQYEPVTVTNPDSSREARRLKRVYEGTSPVMDINGNVVGWTHDWKAGLEDFTTRAYSGARLLKFPSGELATRLPALQVGAGMQGMLDEVRVATSHSLMGWLPADVSLSATDANVVVQMPSDAAAGAVPSSGVVRIGDEMIYYQGRSTGQRTLPFSPRVPFLVPPPRNGNDYHRTNFPVVTLTGVRRAVLGSNGADHAPGSPAAFLEAFPVTELSGGLGTDASDVGVRSASGFDDEGYLVAGSEIIGYTRRAGNNLRNGMFRGAFGTQPQPHNAGELAFALPFRYWDRYIPESDSSELACFQGAFTAAGSNWYELELAVVGNPSRVVTLVRFDGQPEWSAKPTNREGGLYALSGMGPHKLLTASKRPIRADQIEYRVFFPFASGDARGDAWKQTPAVDTVAIHYGNPLVILRREVGGR